MKLLVSALEFSSNLHLGELKKHLGDEVEFVGIFAKHLGKPKHDLKELAIMGIVDAFKKLPFFLKLKNEMLELAKDCDKVLLLDASGFNLPLAKAIKKAYPNKEIIYYILPQVWVWKKYRVFKMQRYCDKLCSIIPFEKDLYPNPKRVDFVGHPLLDEISEFKKEYKKTKRLVFMPGSRKNEIIRLMPLFKELCKKDEVKDYKHILIIPKNFAKNKIDELYGNIDDFEVQNDANKELIKADFAFICSGTATLEAALIGTAFVLVYMTKALDFFIARKIVRVPYVGLANIFFEKMGLGAMHEELLQNRVSIENMLYAFKAVNKERFIENSKKLRAYLVGGSSKKVKELILK